MDERLPGIAWMCFLFGLIMVGCYFFSQTGITLNSIMTINLFPLMRSILSLNFAAFVIFASLSLATIIIIGRKYPFKFALIFTICGYLIGIVLSTILFKQLMDVFILMAFGLIAIPWGISNINKREKEMKYFVKIRAAHSAAGRMLLVLGLGFFFTMLFIGGMSQEKLKQNFVPDFLKITIGDGITLDETFQSQLVDAMVTSQTQLVDSILKYDEFNSFQTKSDVDGLTLKAKLDSMKTALNDSSTKQAALDRIKTQKIDMGQQIISKISLISQLSDFAWIIYAIGGYFAFTMIAGVLIKNLTAIFYSGMFFIFPKIHDLSVKTE